MKELEDALEQEREAHSRVSSVCLRHCFHELLGTCTLTALLLLLLLLIFLMRIQTVAEYTLSPLTYQPTTEVVGYSTMTRVAVLVAWSSGRALVFGRCAFAVLRSTHSHS